MRYIQNYIVSLSYLFANEIVLMQKKLKADQYIEMKNELFKSLPSGLFKEMLLHNVRELQIQIINDSLPALEAECAAIHTDKVLDFHLISCNLDK